MNSYDAKYTEEFKTTPIGRLFELGISMPKIAEITGTTSGAVSKWKLGKNMGSSLNQARALAYLDNLEKGKEIKKVQKDSEHLFMISVPADRIVRFKKLLSMIDLDPIDMDNE